MTSLDQGIFKPTKTSARDRNVATDTTAKGIIEAEIVAREQKTERLKLLRLQKESEAPAVAVKTAAVKAKSGKAKQ